MVAAMDMVLSLVMLAALALLAGAWFLHRRGGPRRQVILMVVLVVIAAVNVAIWIVPTPDGRVPAEQVAE